MRDVAPEHVRHLTLDAVIPWLGSVSAMTSWRGRAGSSSAAPTSPRSRRSGAGCGVRCVAESSSPLPVRSSACQQRRGMRNRSIRDMCRWCPALCLGPRCRRTVRRRVGVDVPRGRDTGLGRQAAAPFVGKGCVWVMPTAEDDLSGLYTTTRAMSGAKTRRTRPRRGLGAPRDSSRSSSSKRDRDAVRVWLGASSDAQTPMCRLSPHGLMLAPNPRRRIRPRTPGRPSCDAHGCVWRARIVLAARHEMFRI